MTPEDFVTVVALLFLLGAVTGPARADAGDAPEYPKMALSNGLVEIEVYLPDAQIGFYRGTRFDWAGVMGRATFRGHTFFGELKEQHDPVGHDHAAGPVEEFSMFDPPGFSEAAEGEPFIKIGVGLLKKEGEAYEFWRQYEIVRPAERLHEVSKDGRSITFRESLRNERGWSYEYEKKLELVRGRPKLKIIHTLRNTGKRTIDTDHYNHTMFMIDGRPIGREYSIEFPFDPTGEIKDKEKAELRGRQLVFLEEVLDGWFWMEVSGYGRRARHNSFIMRCSATGAELRMKTDMKVAKYCVFAEKTALCPEAFVRLEVKPGRRRRWTTTIEFVGD